MLLYTKLNAMRRYLFTTLIALITVFNVSAQSIEQRLADCINAQDWLTLKQVYEDHKSEIQLPFMDKLSQFFICSFFNQPKQAIPIGLDLITNHKTDLGDSFAGMVSILAEDYRNVDDNVKATELLETYPQSKGSSEESKPSIEQRLADCINSQDMLTLKQMYEDHKSEIQLPFMDKLSQFFICSFFNQPKQAIPIGLDLITNHKTDLGDAFTAIVQLLGNNYRELGDNVKAIELLETSVNSSNSEEYKRSINMEYYKTLNEVGVMTFKIPNKDVVIPFEINDKMYVSGKINGKKEDFIWDTGAGTNFISPQLAEKYGLKIYENSSSMVVGGTGASVDAKVAIADKLVIGAITFKNVLFHVADFRSGNAIADKILSEMKPFLGLPLMNKLKEIQFDFENNKIIIPKNLTPMPFKHSNICFNAAKIIDFQITSEGKPLILNFDTGSNFLALFYPYFQNNKQRIESTGKLDSLRMASIGGVNITKSYVLPNFTYTIGDVENSICDLHVEITPRDHTTLDGYFGIEAMKLNKKLIFNLQDMFIYIPE